MKSKQFLQNLRKNVLTFLLLNAALFLNGCTVAEKPEEPFERVEAEQTIRDTFKNDMGLNAIVKSVDNTLFIYLPSKKRIMSLDRAMGFGGKPSKEAKLSFIHVDSEYKDDMFNISYATAELPGSKQFINNITYNYTLQTQEIMNKIYYLIYDSLSEREGHYDFFVVTLSDIKQGLEISLTFNEIDLRKAISGALPFFEFNRRVISQINGNAKAVNDTTGSHIDYTPISLPEFMSDLVLQYLRSGQDIVPELSIEDIVLKRFYDIARMYGYNQFLYLRTFDVVNKTEALTSYDQLQEKFGIK